VLRLTALGGRVAAIGLSGAVHAALFLTPPGHPPASGRAEWTLDVSLEAPPPPEPAPSPTPEPTAAFENHARAVPTHTHPYPVPASHDWIPHDPSLVHPHPHDEHDHDPPPQPAPSAAESAADTQALTADGDAPRFSMVLGSGAGLASGVVSAAAGGHGTAAADDDQAAVPERAVDQRARLVHGATPAYPIGAREEGVEARVQLELVVSPGGAVEQVRVLRPAGHGLDEAAMTAAHHFHFTPAMRQGRAVRVRMPWSVEFRLD
jgi:TonB family protein